MLCPLFQIEIVAWQHSTLYKVSYYVTGRIIYCQSVSKLKLWRRSFWVIWTPLSWDHSFIPPVFTIPHACCCPCLTKPRLWWWNNGITDQKLWIPSKIKKVRSFNDLIQIALDKFHKDQRRVQLFANIIKKHLVSIFKPCFCSDRTAVWRTVLSLSPFFLVHFGIELNSRNDYLDIMNWNF